MSLAIQMTFLSHFFYGGESQKIVRIKMDQARFVHYERTDASVGRAKAYSTWAVAVVYCAN